MHATTTAIIVAVETLRFCGWPDVPADAKAAPHFVQNRDVSSFC